MSRPTQHAPQPRRKKCSAVHPSTLRWTDSLIDGFRQKGAGRGVGGGRVRGDMNDEKQTAPKTAMS